MRIFARNSTVNLNRRLAGLCFEVDRGDLTVDQATEIFENMRSALINAKAREMEEELEEGKKEGKGL